MNKEDMLRKDIQSFKDDLNKHFKEINSLKEQLQMMVIDDQRQQEVIIEQKKRIDKAIEYINKTQMPEGYKKMLLEILGGNNETI